MKKILERGKLLSDKSHPVTKKFMDKWENSAKHLIYAERLPEWRQIGAGVWSGLIQENIVEKSISVMNELHQGQEFETLKKEIKKLEKTSDLDINKMLKYVLNFSKKGPEFFIDYYEIKDTFCYQKIEAIQNENYEFEKNLQNRIKQNQKVREQ